MDRHELLFVYVTNKGILNKSSWLKLNDLENFMARLHSKFITISSLTSSTPETKVMCSFQLLDIP